MLAFEAEVSVVRVGESLFTECNYLFPSIQSKLAPSAHLPSQDREDRVRGCD